MIPEHYSRDIAQRCQNLIHNLRPIVQRGLADDARFGGPLGTTFLLAMATPMIVLPIERIFKPANPRAPQAADDRQLDPALARQVDDVLGPTRSFGAAPFAAPGRWSYVAGWRRFNAAQTWPADLLASLAAPKAYSAAANAPAGRILRDLRNALAHGGITYLDSDGRQTNGDAAMLAFAGAVIDRANRLTGLNVLRVGEDDFCEFLMAWADWLAQPPIRDALNGLDPLAA